MTIKDKETIQRMLGIIEGVCCGLDDRFADTLSDAVQVIDSIINKEGVDHE